MIDKINLPWMMFFFQNCTEPTAVCPWGQPGDIRSDGHDLLSERSFGLGTAKRMKIEPMSNVQPADASPIVNKIKDTGKNINLPRWI